MPHQNKNIIIGPPGTGKTTRLLEILNQELDKGVNPSEIAFMSFTKAAANEVLKRVKDKFGISQEQMPWIRTIHSAAFRLLGITRGQVMTDKHWKKFGSVYGYDFSSDGGVDVEDLFFNPVNTYEDEIRSCYDLGRNKCLATLQEMIGSLPSGSVSLSSLDAYIKRYEKYKIDVGVSDFNDFLIRSINEKVFPDVRVAFIDEAQDLNPLQISTIYSWFWDKCERIYIAGDDDQCVYEWQGASPYWLINLTKKYSTEILTQSWRIPKTVHSIAQKIIKRVKERVEKSYNSRDYEGIFESGLTYDLCQMLEKSEDSMVLCRNKYFFSAIAKQLYENHIPFLCEKTGCGPNPLDYSKNVNAIETLLHLRDGRDIQAKRLRSLMDFISSNDPRELLVRGTKSKLKEEKRKWLSFSALMEDYQMGNLVNHLKKSSDILDLTQMASDYKNYYSALLRKYGKLPDPKIILTTIHASKGREARNIAIIPDMAKKSFQEFSNDSDAEHRLAYVGVTRAKERLIMIDPQSRFYYDYPVGGSYGS